MSYTYEVMDVHAHKRSHLSGLVVVGSADVDGNARSGRAGGKSQARQRVVGLFEGVDWFWKVLDGMRGLSGHRLQGEAARGDAKTRGDGRFCVAASHLDAVDQRQEDDEGEFELHDD
jgi:hypothetical protein